MATAKSGDTVKVDYVGQLEDGTVFDTSVGAEMLEFTIGDGSIIPGFEKAVLGLKLDEEKRITIACQDAYGEYRDELLVVVKREQLPDNFEPKEGQQVRIGQDEETGAVMTVMKVEPKQITLDGNHPLAGKTLIFDITLREIVS